jgi:hypothetical protein
MPTAHTVAGVDLTGIATVLAVVAVVLIPMLLGRRAAPHREDDAPPGDGGIGARPAGPGPRSGGGLPLADSAPSRRRVRDHAPPLRRRGRSGRSRMLPTHAPSTAPRRSAR